MSQEVLPLIQQVKLFLLSQKKTKLLSSVKAQWVLGSGPWGWGGVQGEQEAGLFTDRSEHSSRET